MRQTNPNCRYLFTVKLCLSYISFIGPHNSFIQHSDTFNTGEAIVYETITPVIQKATSAPPTEGTQHNNLLSLFEEKDTESSTAVFSVIHSQQLCLNITQN